MEKIFVFIIVICVAAQSVAFGQVADSPWKETKISESDAGWVAMYTYETKERLYRIDFGNIVVAKKKPVIKIYVLIKDLTFKQPTTYEVEIKGNKASSVLTEYEDNKSKVCRGKWSSLYGELIGLTYALPDKVAETIRNAQVTIPQPLCGQFVD